MVDVERVLIWISVNRRMGMMPVHSLLPLENGSRFMRFPVSNEIFSSRVAKYSSVQKSGDFSPNQNQLFIFIDEIPITNLYAN